MSFPPELLPSNADDSHAPRTVRRSWRAPFDNARHFPSTLLLRRCPPISTKLSRPTEKMRKQQQKVRQGYSTICAPCNFFLARVWKDLTAGGQIFRETQWLWSAGLARRLAFKSTSME